MADRIAKIVRKLPKLKDVTGVWKEADRHLEAGDAAFVADLGIALAERYAPNADRGWQYRSVFSRLLRMLILAEGPESLAQALRLIAAPAVGGRALDRKAASLLVSSRTAEELTVAFTESGTSGSASEELRACLVHELVLRGVAVAEVPGIARWATSSHWTRHPLGRLPLTRSEVEEDADLPDYGVNGGSYSLPYGPVESGGRTAVPGAPVPAATETTTEAEGTAVVKAVANWVEESNGRTEARIFALAEPLNGDTVASAIVALGLDCLKGTGKERKFSASSIAPAYAWRVLFAAASTGGAYNSGILGAYGRLAAWQSLAGLSGAAEGATFGEVEQRVRDCAWYGFDADTKWFKRVAWDLGLAAVTPDGRRLAVLAATDTD